MSELKGIVNTKAKLKGTINTSVKQKGVVSVGGTLIGAEMARRGLKGEKGDTGDTGATGVGISSIAKTGTAGKVDTYTITYTDGNTATFDVTNGQDGADGYSPSASVSKVGDTATISITDENGTTTASVSDGTDGTDGYSPIANVSKSGDTATITITDENGTTTATVTDGADGVVQDVKVNGTSVLSGTVAEVTVPTTTSELTNNSLFARGHIGAFHGTCTTAAATAEKAVTCADFTAADLVAGAMILVEFSNTNSAAVADLQLNVNGTGAKSIKQNNSGTLSNLDSAGYLKTGTTYPFIFNGSYWVTWYNVNTNTIGYTIRTNGMTLPVKTACYRYRICFTSPDGKYYVPANASTSTSATASKTVTTEKIDPFGRIIYYSTTTAISANGTIGTAYQMEQYNGVTLGYSFNRTGAALTMTANKAVYVKCAPQTDGSAIIDDTTPFVQDLPTTEDGKIYIFLGVATAATTIEFTLEHPVYYYKDGGVRQWTNASFGSGSVTDVEVNGTSVVTGGVASVTVPTNTSDLNNDSGFVTSDTKVTQTSSTPSSYTYWRPLLVGSSANGTEGFTPSTDTNTTYTFNTIECQPSSGTIRMGVASMFNGSYTTKISPTTLTANRTITLPNATGTMALTSDIPTVHNVPSGGSAGQVLSKIDGTDYNVEWSTVSGGGGDIVYATSSDSASTVAKTATIVSGTLATLTSGVQAVVKFSDTNTASSPTLNIGSTGAKSIKRYGTTAVGQNANESWVAGSPVLFVYDGTNWVIVGWINTTYSGGASSAIVTGTDNLNYIWSPKQIHDGITGLSSKVQIVRWT